MNIYKSTISHYGINNQQIKTIEELSELQKEICKIMQLKKEDDAALYDIRIRKISEEMADVKIMLKQMEIVFDNTNLIEQYKKEKLTRLRINLGIPK